MRVPARRYRLRASDSSPDGQLPPTACGKNCEPGRWFFRVEVCTAAVVLGLILPDRAWAQGPRLRIIPTFTANAVYDDNITFTSSSRLTGLAWRYMPAFQGTYQASRALAFQGSYSVQGEGFRDSPQLNRVVARQHGALGLTFAADRSTSLSLTGSYLETQTAAELVEQTGLEFGRGPARANGAGLTFERRMTRHGSLRGTYSYQAYAFDQSDVARAHNWEGGWSQRLSGSSSFYLGYQFQLFGLEEGRSAASVLAAGWSQQLTPRTEVSVRAGPRFSADSTSAYVAASIDRRMRRGRLSAQYARGRYLALVREVFTESVGGAASLQLGRALQVSASPAVYWNWDDDWQSRSFRGSLAVAYAAKPWLSFTGSYHYLIQDDGPETWADRFARADDPASRALVMFGVTLSRRPRAVR